MSLLLSEPPETWTRCPEMTLAEISAQGWKHEGQVLFKQDGKSVVFFADIIDVHPPTRKWVEENFGSSRSASLDDFDLGE